MLHPDADTASSLIRGLDLGIIDKTPIFSLYLLDGELIWKGSLMGNDHKRKCRVCHNTMENKHFIFEGRLTNVCIECRKKKGGGNPKKCPRCLKTKPPEQFPHTTNKWCASCLRKAQRKTNHSPCPSLSHKKCRKCGVTFPVSDFYRNTQSKDGYHSYCKGCLRKSVKKSDHAALKIGGWVFQKRSLNAICRKYGVAFADLVSLYEKTDGICPLCQKGFEAPKDFVVDHDHKTNHIRGVLCRTCNVMLGMAKDNPETLEKGAQYLRKKVRKCPECRAF